jgi:hypothetical protein
MAWLAEGGKRIIKWGGGVNAIVEFNYTFLII